MDESLLYSAPTFKAAFFVISLFVLMLIFFRDRESAYKAAIAAAAIPLLGLWSLAISQLALPRQHGHSPATPVFFMTFFIFPYSPILLALCIVAFARHYRSEKSYRIEALLTVLTFVAGAAWTTYFVASVQGPNHAG